MQNLIIFLTKDTLSVAEVRCGVETKHKSVGGKISTKYNDFKQIEKFVEELRSTFNVDNFADDSFDILIVSCGAEQEDISELFTLCHGAKHLNVMNIEKVLPLVALNRGLGKNETKVYTFGDLAWQVTSHAEDKTITVQEVETAGGEELSPDDFSLLFEFRAMVQSDEEEFAKIKAECEEKIDTNKEEFKNLLLDGDYEKLITGMCSHLGMDNGDQRRLTFEYRKKLLNNFTQNKDVLENVDSVAFNQEELDKLIEDKKSQIYLFGNFFELKNAAKVHKTQFVGVLKTTLKIDTDRFINFYKHGVTFKNIRFDEAFYKVKNIQVGDTVLLGKWLGFEIEWVIVDVNSNKNKALLLSREPIDAVGENEIKELDEYPFRTWLNGKFYDEVFSKSFDDVILTHRIENDDVLDKVFLLSKDELQKYHKKVGKITLKPNKFRSVLENKTGESKTYVVVLRDGVSEAFSLEGKKVQDTDGVVCGIVPACWIDTNSEAFYEASCRTPSNFYDGMANASQLVKGLGVGVSNISRNIMNNIWEKFFTKK